MFLTLSYLNNFYYIYILYIYNTAFQPFSQEFTNTLILSTIIPFLCFSTIFSSIYNFGKQGELKGFVAYSSIMNTPFIIVILLGGSRQISYELYDISITILFWYLIIYGINFILLSSVSINLEPIEGKK